VVFCRLSKLQLKLYEHFLHSQPVKALLASTMGEDGAPARKRKLSKAAVTQATQPADGQQQDAAPEEEPQELLAPLAAITALKKLCCHPDLIWDMLHKHKAAELKAQQAVQLAQLREAQKRVSARTATQVHHNCFETVAHALEHQAEAADHSAAQ
jgi:SNF2 family DNA or RNA helicase